jgi:hypothetical protein
MVRWKEVLRQSLDAGCRKGKRSALVDHQSKNREHRQLADALAPRGPQVAFVAGMAQRLPGKVAIVTGDPLASPVVGIVAPVQSCSRLTDQPL